MAILGLGVTGGSQDRTDLGAAQWLVKSSTTHEMTRYLISFPSGAMDHIPREELPAVGKAAHAVVQEAMVAGDRTITAGTYLQTREFNGGLTVLDLPSREAAEEWAAKIATACRCAQEVREFMPDPAVGN